MSSLDVKRLAPHTVIVNLLKRRGAVDINFLAYEIARTPGEVESYVQSLEKAGVVYRQDDKVFLTSASK